MELQDPNSEEVVGGGGLWDIPKSKGKMLILLWLQEKGR